MPCSLPPSAPLQGNSPPAPQLRTCLPSGDSGREPLPCSSEPSVSSGAEPPLVAGLGWVSGRVPCRTSWRQTCTCKV